MTDPKNPSGNAAANVGQATDAQRIEKKMEDKSAESAKADLSAEKGNPGVEDKTPSNKAGVNTPTGPVQTAKSGDAVGPIPANPEVIGAKVEEKKTGTIQREDGTITDAERQELTAYMVAGNRVMLTKAQWTEYQKKVEALNKLVDGRNIPDIPLNDKYWAEKQALDQFVAGMRR